MRPSRSAPLVAAALLAALAGGCSRCGARRETPPPERFVPGAATGVLVVPSLGDAARQAAALEAALVGLPGLDDLPALRAGLGAQLGVDLLDPASLRGAGLDPARGAAVAELPAPAGAAAGPLLLVLPAADPGALAALVARLARDRLGATESGKENANGRPFDVWRRAAGEPPLLATASVEGSLLVAAGPDGPGAIRAALAVEPALSLSAAPAYRRARTALGEGRTAIYFVPRDSPALAALPPLDAVAIGLSGGAAGVTLAGVALTGPTEARLRPLAPRDGGAPPPRSPLAPDTALAVRIAADPAALVQLLGAVDPAFAPGTPAALALAALGPGIDLGLSLAPSLVGPGALADPARADPIRVLRVEIAAPIGDPAAAAAGLERLRETFGGRATAGRIVVRRGPAEAAWTVAGRTLLLALGPPGTLDRLAARAAGQGPAFSGPTPASARALGGDLGGLALVPATLARSLDALPADAFGDGPDGVVARSLAGRAAALLGLARAASLRADLPPGALRVEVALELAPRPPP